MRRYYYKSTGMGCLLWFLAFLLLWIGGCFALVGYHEPAGMRQVFSGNGDWIGLGGGLVALIYFASLLTFHLFGSTNFGLHPSELTVRKRLFGVSSAKTIDRNKMECVEQIERWRRSRRLLSVMGAESDRWAAFQTAFPSAD